MTIARLAPYLLATTLLMIACYVLLLPYQTYRRLRLARAKSRRSRR